MNRNEDGDRSCVNCRRLLVANLATTDGLAGYSMGGDVEDQQETEPTADDRSQGFPDAAVSTLSLTDAGRRETTVAGMDWQIGDYRRDREPEGVVETFATNNAEGP